MVVFIFSYRLSLIKIVFICLFVNYDFKIKQTHTLNFIWKNTQYHQTVRKFIIKNTEKEVLHEFSSTDGLGIRNGGQTSKNISTANTILYK